jgi:hypothetical protein
LHRTVRKMKMNNRQHTPPQPSPKGREFDSPSFGGGWGEVSFGWGCWGEVSPETRMVVERERERERETKLHT